MKEELLELGFRLDKESSNYILDVKNHVIIVEKLGKVRIERFWDKMTLFDYDYEKIKCIIKVLK